MKRGRLILPSEYIATLEEVLGLELSQTQIQSRRGRKVLDKISEHVRKLNEGLTLDREQFLARQYLKDPEIRTAYALYYTTTNLLKPVIPLKELYLHQSITRPLEVLDLGAGTGAASLGAMHFLQKTGFEQQLVLTLVDSVAQNLHDAAKLIWSFAQSMPFRVVINTVHKNILTDDLALGKAYDLIIMMNTLNELSETHDDRLLEQLAALLSPSGSLLLIEPATRLASRRLLAFRDKAVLAHYTVYAPCTRQSFCPALVDKDNWCHSEVDWERPPFIKHIDEIVGTLRLSLKYSYVILNKTGDTLEARLQQKNLSRVVSEVFAEKGRTRFYLCDPHGRNEHIINKRDITQANVTVKELERYDIVRLSDPELREHDIRIKQDSIFQIVLPKSGA